MLLYGWIEVLHIVAVISWMAGLLYLPRIFVYHSRSISGTEIDAVFQVMERKLLLYIMNPAMTVALTTGLAMAIMSGIIYDSGWLHVKILVVLLLVVVHVFFAYCRRRFMINTDFLSERFFRIVNEVPTLLMTIAVVMVVLRPF